MRHLFATLTYSFDGFKYAFRESAFRQELVVFCVAMVLFAISGGSLPDRPHSVPHPHRI